MLNRFGWMVFRVEVLSFAKNNYLYLMKEIHETIDQILNALKAARKVEVIAFLVLLAIGIILLYKFFRMSKEKKISHLDLLYPFKDKNGEFSRTFALAFISEGMMCYMDIKFVDHENVIEALIVHACFIGILIGVVKMVDVIALKNGTKSDPAPAKETTVTATATVVTADAPTDNK